MLFHLMRNNIFRLVSSNIHALRCSYTGRRRNNGGRRRPVFPVAMWNVHDRVLHDEVRACIKI